jgi:hypothetical protein
MDREGSSETVCKECHGKAVSFLWSRDTTAEGRWVINEAMIQPKGSGKNLGCCCGLN